MRVAVVGRGRMGNALAASLREVGVAVIGPTGRDLHEVGGADVVLLAVPDASIAEVAKSVPPGPLVGHLSGAMTIDVLAPHESFNVHPLLTVTGAMDRFAGCSAAVAGSTPRALQCAQSLARILGMHAITVADSDRGAYHAAATIAANFLVTIEGVAEELAATAGVTREALVPLVRAAVDNWASKGAAGALTGPIARGDEATIAAQRLAVEARIPHQLPLFDALVEATRSLSAGTHARGES